MQLAGIPQSAAERREIPQRIAELVNNGIPVRCIRFALSMILLGCSHQATHFTE